MVYERTIDISARVIFNSEMATNSFVVARLHNLAIDGNAHVRGTMRVCEADDHTSARTFIVDKVYASDGSDVSVSGYDDVQAASSAPIAGGAQLTIRADALSDPELFTPLTVSVMIFADIPEEDPVAYDVDVKLVVTVIT